MPLNTAPEINARSNHGSMEQPSRARLRWLARLTPGSLLWSATALPSPSTTLRRPPVSSKTWQIQRKQEQVVRGCRTGETDDAAKMRAGGEEARQVKKKKE